MYYQDATKAVQQANHLANIDGRPQGIAHAPGKGWTIYDPADGCQEGEPEFLCIGTGYPPLPLSYTAMDVWLSIVRAAAEEFNRAHS